jgi:NADPH-dependent 7-cyano-7-deazaguanine reductase QueF
MNTSLSKKTKRNRSDDGTENEDMDDDFDNKENAGERLSDENSNKIDNDHSDGRKYYVSIIIIEPSFKCVCCFSSCIFSTSIQIDSTISEVEEEYSKGIVKRKGRNSSYNNY